MYCQNCGTLIREGSMFCQKCGTRVPIETEETSAPAVTDASDYEDQSTSQKPKKKKKSKGKKALMGIIAIFTVLIIAAGALGVLYLTSGEQKIIRALNSEKYDRALEIYDENFHGGDASKILIRLLESRVEKMKNDFDEEKIEFSVVDKELSTIRQMQISDIADLVDTTKAYVTALNDSRTAFNIAESLFDSGEYLGALANYHQVAEDDKNYEIAVEKTAIAELNYRSEVLTNAAAFVSSGDYANAFTELAYALVVFPDDEAILEQIEIYKSDYIAEKRNTSVQAAASYAGKGDFANAIKTIDSLLKENKDDAELQKLYDQYKDSFISVTVKKVDELVGKKQFSEAQTALEAALKVLPLNDNLTSKLEEVQNKQPIYLSDMTPVNGGWDWNEGDPTDPFGVTYSDAENFVIFSGNSASISEHYAEYRVYGKYKYLTGDLISQKDCGEDANSYVEVYADDELVYTSPEIVRKSDLSSIKVNIDGADYVKIIFNVSGSYLEANERSSLLAMNMQFLAE